MKTINERISANITTLRKSAKLTQLEFAEKLNYSDKAVSKWENGDSIPSIEVLENICKFFDVTLNDITSEKPIIISATKEKKKLSPNKLIIICLSMIFVWLLATILFVYSSLIWQESEWILFVWAVPASIVVGVVFNAIWGSKRNVFVLISILIWTSLASIYLNFIEYNAWVIFILGIPLQILLFLWSQLDGNKHKERLMKERLEKEKLTNENKIDSKD